MARVQLALNVGDLAAEIERYRLMFGVDPHKVRDGYANFIIENPPLKLVLIAGQGEPGSLNHVGVEMESTAEVLEAAEHATVVGLPTTLQPLNECCYALQDKVWVHGGELSWEFYTVLDDSPMMAPAKEDACCAPATQEPVTLHATKCC